MSMWYVAAGGFAGAVARAFVCARMAPKKAERFPYGTMAVNLTGSFLGGLLLGLDLPQPWPSLIGAGLLGAFTTFSTFNMESVRMAMDKKRRRAFVYVVVTYALGIALALAGYHAGLLLQ